MTLTELVTAQLTDPFRFGMLVILYLTMLRTRATSGTLAPLVAGAVFVAVIIPMTFAQIGMGPDLYRAVGVGIVTNAVMLGIIWLAHRLLPRRG